MPDEADNGQTDHLVYTFGDFSLETARGVLSRGGEVLPIRPKAWSVLLHFLRHRGELVRRSDLIEAVWKNTAVTDDSITQCIVEIRRVLGDADHTMIRTVPRRGFVFEMPVTERHAMNAEPPPLAKAGGDSSRWRWIAAAMLIFVVVAGLWTVLRDADPPTSQPPEVTASIAVLAFTDMTADGDRQYFGDGIAEEILNHLAQIPELRVISRSSSFLFRDDPDIPVIADELGVDFILEGSVRGAGDDLRVTAQLINAETNAHVWAESYDHQTSLENLIAVQNEIAASVTAAIGVETGALLRPTPEEDLQIDPEAMDDYLQGLFYIRKIQTVGGSEEDFDMARERLNAAIDKEPSWALPHAAIGTALHFLATSDYVEPDRTSAMFEDSREYLLEAIRLDPEHGPAYGSLAFIAHSHDLDFARAEALYAKAAALGHRRYWGRAIMMRAQGRFEEAIDHYQQAALDDPLSNGVAWQLADALRCVGRYEESARHIDRLLEQSPDSLFLLEYRATLSIRMGDEAGARRIIDEHGVDEWPMLFGPVRALLGMREEAEAALAEIESHAYWNPRVHTITAVAIGEYERALDYLERVAEEQPLFLGVSQCPDDIGPLADNSRFRTILEGVGIPVNAGTGTH